MSELATSAETENTPMIESTEIALSNDNNIVEDKVEEESAPITLPCKENEDSESSSSSSSDDEEMEIDDGMPMASILPFEDEDEILQTNWSADNLPKTRNETLDLPSRPSDLPETFCCQNENDASQFIPFGTLHGLVGSFIVIESKPALLTAASLHAALDESSIVVIESLSNTEEMVNRQFQVLGQVHEVFGPVASPFYSILPRESLDINGLAQFFLNETVAYFVRDRAHFLPPVSEIIKAQGKGSDASNVHDEEVGLKEGDPIEFSDDEAEQEYRRKQRSSGKNKRKLNSTSVNVEDNKAPVATSMDYDGDYVVLQREAPLSYSDE